MSLLDYFMSKGVFIMAIIKTETIPMFNDRVFLHISTSSDYPGTHLYEFRIIPDEDHRGQGHYMWDPELLIEPKQRQNIHLPLYDLDILSTKDLLDMELFEDGTLKTGSHYITDIDYKHDGFWKVVNPDLQIIRAPYPDEDSWWNRLITFEEAIKMMETSLDKEDNYMAFGNVVIAFVRPAVEINGFTFKRQARAPKNRSLNKESMASMKKLVLKCHAEIRKMSQTRGGYPDRMNWADHETIKELEPICCADLPDLAVFHRLAYEMYLIDDVTDESRASWYFMKDMIEMMDVYLFFIMQCYYQRLTFEFQYRFGYEFHYMNLEFTRQYFVTCVVRYKNVHTMETNRHFLPARHQLIFDEHVAYFFECISSIHKWERLTEEEFKEDEVKARMDRCDSRLEKMTILRESGVLGKDEMKDLDKKIKKEIKRHDKIQMSDPITSPRLTSETRKFRFLMLLREALPAIIAAAVTAVAGLIGSIFSSKRTSSPQRT
jgi:hypothetical protein